MTGPLNERKPGEAPTNDRAFEIADAAIVVDATPIDKSFTTIAAELALAGFALHRLTCGAYLIARWDRTEYAPDLCAVRAFLDRVKGRA
jgi:hypothetical protein